MVERLYKVLAELFDGKDPAVVAHDAGLDTTKVNWGASGAEVWSRAVIEAQRQGKLHALVAHAIREYPEHRSRLWAALEHETTDHDSFEQWMLTLARAEQRAAIIRSRAPVTVLMLVGPRGQGHRHFALWARRLRQDRRPLVELDWPWHDGVTARFGQLVGELARQCRLREMGCREVPSEDVTYDPAAWTRWAQYVTPELIAALLKERQPAPSARPMVLVRHLLNDVTPDDPAVIGHYLERIWAPVAAHIREKGPAEMRCLLSFEALTKTDAEAATLCSVARPSEEALAVPELAPLGNVHRDDIVMWLTQHAEPLQNRIAHEGSGDPETFAEGAWLRRKGVYEDVIEYFSSRGSR